MKQHNKPRVINALRPRLGGDNLLTAVLRGVFLANQLVSTANLTSNNQETEHIKTQTNVNTKCPYKQQNNTQNTYANRKDRVGWATRRASGL